MRYSFEKLVTVSFLHDYFSNGGLSGISVEPSEATSRILSNYGLMTKPIAAGFHILYDAAFAGSQRTREQVLGHSLQLRFVIRLQNNNFYHVTEGFAADPAKSAYYFHNRGYEPDTLRKSLQSGQFAAQDDVVALADLPGNYFVKPFAVLDLVLSAGAESEYSIRFKSRQAHWRYILLNDDLRSLSDLAIIDSVSAEAFEGPESLGVQGREALAFRSKNPISFSQKMQQVFQLVDNYDPETGRYRVIRRALPSADPSYISLVDSDSNQNLKFSEIIIH